MEHCYGLKDPKSTVRLRFQDLPDEIQDEIVDAFERRKLPSISYSGLTQELLLTWYADTNVFKFWVNMRSLRMKSGGR